MSTNKICRICGHPMICLGRVWNKSYSKKICKWSCKREHREQIAYGGQPNILYSVTPYKRWGILKGIIALPTKVFYENEEKEAYTYARLCHKNLGIRPKVKSSKSGSYIKYESIEPF